MFSAMMFDDEFGEGIIEFGDGEDHLTENRKQNPKSQTYFLNYFSFEIIIRNSLSVGIVSKKGFYFRFSVRR